MHKPVFNFFPVNKEHSNENVDRVNWQCGGMPKALTAGQASVNRLSTPLADVLILAPRVQVSSQ